MTIRAVIRQNFTMKFLTIFILSPFFLFSNSVIVSVAPHKYFVEQIAGDTLKVLLMVPASSTPHSYEPPPKQILEASHSDMWFRVGESFEKKALEAIQSHHPSLIVVDLRKGLPLIPSPHQHHSGKCCSAEGADLHIWLSLRLAQIQAQTIAEALAQHYPENSALFASNLEKFLRELRTLDAQFKELLEPVKGKTAMVSHPAYAYFCRDYDLKQLSIEIEGQEPTPKAVTALLEKARALKIHTIFTQAQYGIKGAQLIANLLHAKLVSLDPYSEDYLNSMTHITHAFQEGL